MILEELEDYPRWELANARSLDAIAKLAASAIAEYSAGKTQEFAPERL
ncbi:hypothetical protein QUA13_31295 [Microcoleus sp. S28C3]